MNRPASAEPRLPPGLGALVRRAISRTSDAFGSRADWSLEPAAHGNRDPDSDAARFPQRPLILGDKWDF